MKLIFKVINLFSSRHELIMELVRRELKDRHTGQVIGVILVIRASCLTYELICGPVRLCLSSKVFLWGASRQIFSTNILAGVILLVSIPGHTFTFTSNTINSC